MSNAAKTKLELIIDLKKKLFDNKLVEAQKKMTTATDKMKGSLHSLKGEAVRSFQAMKDQFPSIGQGVELLSNKWVLMASGIAAVSGAALLLGNHLITESKRIEAFQNRVTASFNIQGESLKKTTAQALSISDVLKVDQFELLKAANSLTKEFEDQGITINDSLKLIKQGIQATGGNFDLNEIEEYASQIKVAGFNAQQFVALSVFGRKQGLFNDKGVDAVKEFNLRIKEMTPAAKAALKGIGLSSDAILKGLNNGSIQTIDVLRQVSAAMGKVNASARQAAIADLFGGPGEDAGVKFLLSLKDINLSLKDQAAGMEDITTHQNELIGMNQKIQKSYMVLDDAIRPMRREWELSTARAKVFFFKVIAKGYKAMFAQTRLIKNQIVDMSSVQKQFQKAVFSSSLQVRQLFEELRRAGEGTSLQKKILSQINDQYSRYLQNRLDEKSTLLDIADAQKKITDGIRTEIALKSKKDQIVALETTLFKRQHDTLNAFAEATKLAPEIIAEKFRIFEQTHGTGIETILSANGITTKQLAKFNQSERLVFRDLLNAKSSTQDEIKKISDFFNAFVKGDPFKTPDVDDGLNRSGNSSNDDPSPDLSTQVASVTGHGSSPKSIVINIEALNKGGINTENTILNQMSADEIEEWFEQAMTRLIRNVELSN